MQIAKLLRPIIAARSNHLRFPDLWRYGEELQAGDYTITASSGEWLWLRSIATGWEHQVARSVVDGSIEVGSVPRGSLRECFIPGLRNERAGKQ